MKYTENIQSHKLKNSDEHKSQKESISLEENDKDTLQPVKTSDLWGATQNYPAYKQC